MRTMASFLFLSLALGCGGATSSASTTSGSAASAAPQVAGACYTESLGICQRYYQGDTGLGDAQTACTESAVPGTSGAWVPDCPSARRLGDCADVNGNLQARFYTGSAQYPDAESAQNACEADSGTWSP